MSPHHQPVFDAIVLTAANEAQAAGYRAQLSDRQARGLLPPGSSWHVIADPGGRRVGSGCSTWAVLAELAATTFTQGSSFAERFAGRRILIAHSGGDARRLPPYTALGKIFMPMPCDMTTSGEPGWRRSPATLFDLLLSTLTCLPRHEEGQIVLCSGDVLLTFDPAAVDLHAPGGIVGLGFAATPDVGERHGVYLTPNPSVGGPVTDFLQKPSRQRMREHGAVDATGRILVDTGVFCLAPQAAEAWLTAAGIRPVKGGAKVGPGLYRDVLAGRVGIVDLYQELALALPRDMTRERYLASASAINQTPSALKSLGKFFDLLRADHLPFQVAAVSNGEFFHIGATRDLLCKFSEPSRTAKMFHFVNGNRTVGQVARADDRLTAFNSVGEVSGLQLNGQVYIESCDLTAAAASKTVLHGDNVLVGLTPDFDTAALTGLSLPVGVGLVQLPLPHPVLVLFGVDDDNKATLESGASRLLNQPLQRLIDAGVPEPVLWPPECERSAWTARLWVTGEGNIEALRLLLQVLHGPSAEPRAVRRLLHLWQQQPVTSWAELGAQVDHAELLKHRLKLAVFADQSRFLDDLLEHDDFGAAEVVARVAAQSAAAVGELLRSTACELESRFPAGAGLEPLTRARVLRALALIVEACQQQGAQWGDIDLAAFAGRAVQSSDDLTTAAFASMAAAMEGTVHLPHEPRPAAILHDQAVWVTAPARIDFAGGWSDTPPICLERGGSVLNAAVTLNRQYPIQCMAKLNDEGCVRLTSIDLGRQEIFRDAEEINGPIELAHWSSLAKAALVLAGIVPEAHASHKTGKKQTLKHWLEVLGGGLDLTLFSGLPQGSGMGTSSILAAAVLACLARVKGQELTHAELIGQTSLLEQRMTTGGGWQDQIGGIVGGVKLIRTQPGIEQNPSLQWSVFGSPSGSGGQTSEALRSRLLLYFTGHKRLARNILKNVIGRYMAREPEALQIIDRLKKGAEDAKQALEANDLAAFAGCIDDYWELKKAFDPGSTNALIEDILDKVKPYTTARLLCGAGGGGFMLLLARDGEAADRIRAVLRDAPPNPSARFFDFAVDPQGLSVTVL